MTRRHNARTILFSAALLPLLLLGGCRTEDGETPGEGANAAALTRTPGGMVDLAPLGYELGDPAAPVTVVEFSDFGCPYCAQFALETFPLLMNEYVETGRVRWKFVPFVLGIFPNGAEAARAAECAGAQERFWPMHDVLYVRQREWKASDDATETFQALAAEAGLDAERFAACYREAAGAARTEANNEAAAALQVRATPSFLVNGHPVQGALPLNQFREILDLAGGIR